MNTRTPAYLTGVTERRNATGSGSSYAWPKFKVCRDCGKFTDAGQVRNGQFRCGPCDIEFCEGKHHA